VRLHELAKELNADSKRLLAIAKELGLPGIKSASSNVEPGTIGILKAAWTEELSEIAAKEAKKAAKAKKVKDDEAAAAAEKAAAEKAAAPPAPEPDVAPAAAEVAPPAPPAAAPTIVEPSRAEPEPAPALATAPPETLEPEADAAPEGTADGRKVLVTIGGHVALPPNADELKGVAGEDEAGEPEAGGAVGEAKPATADEGRSGKTETSGPTRRRGAKILGRIELKPQDVTPRHRPQQAPGPSGFDPADPTLPAPGRRGVAGGQVAARKTIAEQEAAKAKAKAKPGSAGMDWVFDPEDNTALAAIRIGHFTGQRRPAPRRPPMRRSIIPAARGKARKPAERPTHGIEVRPPISARDLSEMLGVKAREILEQFEGAFDTRDKNAMLDGERLLELAIKMNREITVLPPETEADRLLADEEKRREALVGEPQPRPPVVAVMGHVDHGKTSLLDALRKTKVAAGEAGGITQRTSAYFVRSPKGAGVTFLDTPGHKAFTEMRARGAQLTDVAVLVVAGDDGVMEQTEEAIDHAVAAGVPMVVAINKMDKPGADGRKVRQQLATKGVMVEDWGGEVGVVEVSATSGKGLPELVERLALETEILELRAHPDRPAKGVVVDSVKDPERGIVATVVVKDGTLRAKDAVLAGTAVGRVRFLLDDRGQRIAEAGPGTPAQVLGFEEPPEAGSQLYVVEDINRARVAVRERLEALKKTAEVPAAVDTVTLENLFEKIAEEKVRELNVMIKADAHGTLDVLRRTVEDLQHPEVKFKVIRAAVGPVTEDDVLLASASKAMIIGFAVKADANAKAQLARTGVSFKTYEIIYEMTDDLVKALEGELGTEKQERITGHAQVRAVFKSSKLGNIAGCYVTDGVITRDSRIRVVRGNKTLWTGRLDSLKRFKDDVKEVRENYECGLHLAGFEDVAVDDVLEAFEVTEVKRTLTSDATT